MIKIAVCDDNSEICEFLRAQLLEEYGYMVNVYTYVSAEGLLADYEPGMEKNISDILLMDIDVNGVNGIDVVERLQKTYGNLKVIFITGHIDYSTDIFRVSPSNFLVKPIDCRKLRAAVDKAMEELKTEDGTCFAIACKGNVFKVKTRDILFFESEKRRLILHSRGESFTLYRKLDDVQEELPACFLRCHKSYLVNMNEIKSLKPMEIELSNGITVPVSRPKYKETRERFLEYIGNNI